MKTSPKILEIPLVKRSRFLDFPPQTELLFQKNESREDIKAEEERGHIVQGFFGLSLKENGPSLSSLIFALARS